ncbi:MAG TPA: hypothetical protein VIJ72_05390 [Rhizomicrobium sp.]
MAIALVLIAGFAATLAVNLPGQLSYDSVAQLLDGRMGHYNTWHPPIMAWLLGIFDAMLAGSSLFVVFQAALGFGALLSLLWLAPRPSWWVAIIALLLILTPQLLLYQGIVWKDVLFADAGLAGFAALAHAAQHWRRPKARFALIVLAFVLFALAAMTRQNGVIVLGAGSIGFGLIAAKYRERKARAIGYGVLAFFAGLALAVSASIALAERGDGGNGARAELAMLQTYDMIGMLKAQPSLALQKMHVADPELEAAMRGDGARLYSPVRNDTFSASAALLQAMSAAPNGLIFAQWLGMVRHHTFLYLKMRSRVFAWVFFTPDIIACRPVYTGIDGSAADLRSLGLTARIRPHDWALFDYAKHFDHTPVFSHPAFALLGAGVLYLLLRRHRPADIALAFMLLAAFGFTASFLLASVACDYRYLYFLDLSVLATILYLATDFPLQAKTAIP